MSLRVFATAIATAGAVGVLGCSSEGSECGGHNQPVCEDDDFRSREGGEIRIEHIQLKDGNIAVNAQAWFLEDQDPMKLPGLMFNTCSHVQSYESTVNPSEQTFQSRTWKDLGDTLSLSFNGSQIELQRETGMADKSGLVHDVIYVKDQAASGGVSSEELTLGARYQASATDVGVLVDETLRLPGEYTTTSGLTIPGDNTFQADEGFTWEYTSADEAETGIAAIAFVGMVEGVNQTWFCPTERTGSHTITPEDLALVPPAGTLAVFIVSHQVVEFQGRVLDLIGINQKLADYTIE